MAALLEASETLAYLNSPVEVRLDADSLNWLRARLAPPLFTPASPFDIGGVRLIVDPTIPPRRIEFRDRDGNVVSSFDLP